MECDTGTQLWILALDSLMFYTMKQTKFSFRLGNSPRNQKRSNRIIIRILNSVVAMAVFMQGNDDVSYGGQN